MDESAGRGFSRGPIVSNVYWMIQLSLALRKKNLHTASCNIKTELCQRETVWSNHKKKKEEKKTHFGLHVVNSVKL